MFRKIFISLLFNVSCISFFYSQTLPSASWVNQIGGASDEQGRHVSLDSSGNVIVVGRFAGTVDFDPSAGIANLTSAGNDDIFVAKYTNAGVYLWAIKMGAGNGDSGEGVTTDGADNVYVTGRFQGTADFDPSAATNNLVSAGNDDIFVAKYNSSGAYVWAFRIGNTSADAGRFITYDATGYIYVTGRVSNTNVDFDPSVNTNNLSSTGGEDVFLAKYDANLAPSSTSFYQWAFKIGAGSNDSGEGVTTDGSGNVFITGFFRNSFDFDPSAATSILTSAGNDDIFLAKYNSAGAYQWAIRMGGASADQGRMGVYSVSQGAVYITGFFAGAAADFDPSAASVNLSSIGNDDAFVGKYDGNTGAYIWAFKIGSTGDDRGEGIATDASGNVYIDGRIGGTADFDPSAATSTVTTSGGDDIYLAEYAASMLYQFAFKVGAGNNDRGAGVAVDNSGFMYITGLFSGGPMDFDPTAITINKTSIAGDDIFLAKYGTNIFLPIELLSFNAAICENSKEVCLDWVTGTELNNNYFTVERSSDAVNFTDVLSVKGAGNSNQTHYYAAVDHKPLNGMSYYRLKQTDFNGNVTRSSIVAITSDFEVKTQNPAFCSEVPIVIKGKQGEVFHIKFYDSIGRLCFSDDVTLTTSGNNRYLYNLENKLKGNIVYLVVGSDYRTTKTKIILE